MAYKSLREFIDLLEAEGELVRVREPVSTQLEMTEIQTRLLRNGGPAVLFEKPVMPDGSISPIPCLANLFGTVKRVAMGVTLEGKARTTAAELREVGELLAFLKNPTPPRGLADAAAGQDGHGDAAEGGEEGAGAGGGAEGRPDRPDRPARSGLLAR
jgi:4-hydroxy-3-polyprenylbenzoate decarboxylase